MHDKQMSFTAPALFIIKQTNKIKTYALFVKIAKQFPVSSEKKSKRATRKILTAFLFIYLFIYLREMSQ